MHEILGTYVKCCKYFFLVGVFLCMHFKFAIILKEIMLNFIAIGSILGCLVVIFGAFGAHGLKDVLDDHGKSIYDKAILYQMFHVIAILILGIIEKIVPEIQLQLVGWSFLLGILFFSGSLYILSITGIKWFGIITPIGGLFFILGWLLLFIKTF